jgi:MYXO-CTERM domain-containing protein
MSSLHRRRCTLLLGGLLIMAADRARADEIFNVSLDTSKLASDYTGPFGIDFELVGTNGNTITVSDFSFGSGSPGPGSAFLTGGASGDLSSTVTLTDTASFFSDFNQQFTPGATLTFTVDTTLVAPPTGGIPDNFSMVLFSSYDPVNGYNPATGSGGTPIPTTDPTGNDTFFNFNVNGPGMTTVSSYPSSSGDVTITVTPASVPEPSSGVIMAVGLLGMAGALSGRRRR